MKNLSDFTIGELENYCQELLADLPKVAEEWAKAKSVYATDDDKKKSVLATIMNEYEGSQAAKECLALGHQTYLDYLEKISVSRGVFLRSEIAYDIIKLKLDFLRTIISNRREEIKNFKG